MPTTPIARFARYSSVWWHSRPRARCLDDASLTPASARPQSNPTGMCLSTRLSKTAGHTPWSRCMSVSVTTMTHATPSMPVGMPTALRGRGLAAATTLVVADATIAARTEARALSCRDLRPLADSSSTPSSHHGTDHRPTSQNTLEKRIPDYGSRIIGLLAKPVERIMMISLFVTFHYSWPIQRERGWNTFRPIESKVGRT